MIEQTRGELQYRDHNRILQERGMEQLGLSAGWAYYDDPRHLVFTLARYKFVAKMFEGFESVLEIGCGDGFASRIVAQTVGHLTGIDFDPKFIENSQRRPRDRWPSDFACHDLLEGPYPGTYQGVFALDVLEHIAPSDEDRFLRNAIASLSEHGALLIGMPSVESQVYASPQSKAGHVNCKTMPDLKATLTRYFHHVFMFSMNDEVIHTGYHRMAHYIIALCCEVRAS